MSISAQTKGVSPSSQIITLERMVSERDDAIYALHDKIAIVRRAVEFMDMVRETPAHERPEGAMRDALRGLEDAARGLL